MNHCRWKSIMIFMPRLLPEELYEHIGLVTPAVGWVYQTLNRIEFIPGFSIVVYSQSEHCCCYRISPRRFHFCEPAFTSAPLAKKGKGCCYWESYLLAAHMYYCPKIFLTEGSSAPKGTGNKDDAIDFHQLFFSVRRFTENEGRGRMIFFASFTLVSFFVQSVPASV